MANLKSKAKDELRLNRNFPTSAEVAKAAYDREATIKLVQDYGLTAADLAFLIDRLPEKAVPW